VPGAGEPGSRYALTERGAAAATLLSSCGAVDPFSCTAKVWYSRRKSVGSRGVVDLRCGDGQPELVPAVVLGTNADVQPLEVVQRAVSYPIRRQRQHPLGQPRPQRQPFRFSLGEVGVQAEVAEELHRPESRERERDLRVEKVAELVHHQQVRERSHVDPAVRRTVGGLSLGAPQGVRTPSSIRTTPREKASGSSPTMIACPSA
jgi:hypothetical protein